MTKNYRSNIIAEEIDKRRAKSLEQHIQHFKSKVNYKAANDQCYINTRQEKVEILEGVMEAELEYRRHMMHCMEEDLDETRKK